MFCVQAVKHLHDHNLIHMDIKPENIFVGVDGICKLGDFGLVIDLAKETPSHGTLGTMGGDNKYMAAEILEGKYTKACDVFSLGVTILELATDLDLPSGGELWHKLRNTGPDPGLTKKLSHGMGGQTTFPSHFMHIPLLTDPHSIDLRRVIQLMMGRDYERRPTVNQVLEIPSVRKAKKRRSRQIFLWALVCNVLDFSACQKCYTVAYIFFLAHRPLVLDPANVCFLPVPDYNVPIQPGAEHNGKHWQLPFRHDA